MAAWDGKVLFALIAAVLLSAAVGRIVAVIYRRRVLALMSQRTARADASASDVVATPPELAAAPGTTSSTAPAGIAQNRKAQRRSAMAFVALCLIIALFQAWWSLSFAYADGGYGPVKLLIMTLVFAWVMVPALGLLRRWSWWRTALVSVAYMAGVGVLVWLRSTAQQEAAGLALFLLTTIAPVLLAYGLAASGRARATGPYLLPLFLLLTGASVLGTEALPALAAGSRPGPLLEALLRALGAYGTFAVFIFGPWLLMARPAWRGARRLAQAYEAGHFSEPIYMLAGYWLVALLIGSLMASHSVGAAALTLLLGWLLIPPGVMLMRRLLPPPSHPPHLLVLRVFRRDEEVQALFDSVIDRWRYSGRTSLIAGTDLALRTLDPDELFAFLNGRLRDRFIGSAAELQRQLATIDRPADADGRFRVADFYCFDATWKLALDALVARTDVVLMDLRGFAAANAGCLHELGVLARAPHLRRVVVLFDGRTDRAAAESAVAGASDRFLWVDAGRIGGGQANAILKPLLEAAP